jgi:hypothetical protein
LSAIERINRSKLAITSISCKTPLHTEAVLKKGDPLIAEKRKSKCTKVRARDILKTTETDHLNVLKSIHTPPGFICVLMFRLIS